jgi:hypothetical protein
VFAERHGEMSLTAQIDSEPERAFSAPRTRASAGAAAQLLAAQPEQG